VEVTQSQIRDVRIVTPTIWSDARGCFLEAFNARRFAAAGLPFQFVQDNHSRSHRNVLRGLHYQLYKPQGKLVSVIRGKIFDVAVDIRKGSPSFGRWAGVILDDVKRESFWIPPGFAHGFCTISDEADVFYKCTDYYDPQDERGILWSDPALAIRWPIQNPLMSEKDEKYSTLANALADLPEYE
jgi:dTDP-4-dehydrorhamnose 3,5-epimerase